MLIVRQLTVFLLAWMAYLTGSFAYSGRIPATIGTLLTFIMLFVPLLLAGFDRLSPQVRSWYTNAYPLCFILGPALIIADIPEWMSLYALAYASPAVGPVFLMELDRANQGGRSRDMSQKPDALYAIMTAVVHVVLEIIASLELRDSPSYSTNLRVARHISSLSSFVVCIAFWWSLTFGVTSAMEREMRNAIEVLQACTEQDITLAATKMRMWRDGPLFRATEKVVSVVQHANLNNYFKAKSNPSHATSSETSFWVNPFVPSATEETSSTNSTDTHDTPTEGARRRVMMKPLTVLCVAASSESFSRNFTFSQLLDIVTTTTEENKGTALADVSGQTIFCVWGLQTAPNNVTVSYAVETSIHLQSAITSLVGLDEVSLRMGLAHGMGERIDHKSGYRVTGPPVESSLYLMQLASHLELTTVIDAECARCTRHTHLSRPVDIVVEKEGEPAVTVYELLRSFNPGGAGQEWLYEVHEREQEASAMYSDYNSAFRCLSTGRITEGELLLQEYLNSSNGKGDTVAAKFHSRVKRAAASDSAGGLNAIVRHRRSVWNE